MQSDLLDEDQPHGLLQRQSGLLLHGSRAEQHGVFLCHGHWRRCGVCALCRWVARYSTHDFGPLFTPTTLHFAGIFLAFSLCIFQRAARALNVGQTRSAWSARGAPNVSVRPNVVQSCAASSSSSSSRSRRRQRNSSNSCCGRRCRRTVHLV